MYRTTDPLIKQFLIAPWKARARPAEVSGREKWWNTRQDGGGERGGLGVFLGLLCALA